MRMKISAIICAASLGLFADVSDNDSGLWRLSFRAGTKGKEIVLDSAKCPPCVEEKTVSGRRLVWRGLSLDAGDGTVDVTCTIERNNVYGWDEYRISVKNRSSAYGLFETEYPRFKSLLKPGEGSLVRPGGCWGGQRLRNYVAGRFPFPDWASPFQFAIFEKDAGGGTLVAALDPEGCIKYLNYTDKFDFSFSTPAVDAGVPGKAGAPEYAVALYGFDGGWVDAAKTYRKWSISNARWMKKGPLVTRKERSIAASRDIGLWLLFQYDLSVPLSLIENDRIGKALARIDGRFPVAVHMYGWWQRPRDGLRAEYPEYPPAREGFAEMCARLSDKGVRIMPYLNGRLWDWSQKDFKSVERWMCRNADGTLHKERWGTHDHSAVCPVTEIWGEKLVSVGKSMVNGCNVNALYYDQIASMTAVPCYAANHGHPVGGGNHWVGGYRKCVEMIHSALPDIPLTSENWAEPYTDLFDGFLVWGPNVGNDVPLLPVVYSGYMLPFGCRVLRDGEISPQAFYSLQARSFLWGAQPGWERSWVLGDKYRAHFDFLLKLAEKRRLALDFFADGEFLGPVDNEVNYDPLRLKVLRWGKTLDAELPPVMAARWANPAGERMIAVVNTTETHRRFAASGISMELEPLEVKFVKQPSSKGE